MQKSEALQALRDVMKNISVAMTLHQAEPLLNALSECYRAGCTDAEIHNAQYGDRYQADGKGA